MEAVSSSTAAAEGAGKSSEAKTKAAISEGEEKEQSSVSGGESSSSGAVKDDKEDSGEGGEKVGGGGGGGEGEGMDTGTEAEKKAAEGGGKDKEGEGKKEKKEPEPDFEMLPNPARVLPQQVSTAEPYKALNFMSGYPSAYRKLEHVSMRKYFDRRHSFIPHADLTISI